MRHTSHIGGGGGAAAAVRAGVLPTCIRTCRNEIVAKYQIAKLRHTAIDATAHGPQIIGDWCVSSRISTIEKRRRDWIFGIQMAEKKMNHEQPSYPRIYLDEMTIAHFPRPDGALPATSKVIIPDLQRTGIRSKYSKDWPTQPFDVTGRITHEFLSETAATLKSVPHPNLPLFYSEIRANSNHRVNLSKALIQYEDGREEKYQSMRRDVRKRVKHIGFNNIDSASMCLSPLALSVKSALSGKAAADSRGGSNSPVRQTQLKASSSSSSSHKPLSRIAFFKTCLANADPPKTFKKKRFGVLGRKTTLPIITPTPLSGREEEDGGGHRGHGHNGHHRHPGELSDAGLGDDGRGDGGVGLGDRNVTTTEERYDDEDFDETQEYNDQEFEGGTDPHAAANDADADER